MWEEYRIPSSQLGERSNYPLLGSGEEPQKLCKHSYFDVAKVLSEARNTKTCLT